MWREPAINRAREGSLVPLAATLPQRSANAAQKRVEGAFCMTGTGARAR